MKNRKIFPVVGSLVLAALFHSPGQAQNRSLDLKPSPSTRQIYRVQTRLEGKGTVMPDDEKSLKMLVDGRFRYDERVIARQTALKSIRAYERAEARIRVGNRTLANRLDRKSQIIVAQTTGGDDSVKLASLGGPLSQNQFELINTPANTLILAELFRKSSVKPGQSWKPGDGKLARFLNIDAVDENTVEIKLESVRNNVATLYIGGDAAGTIDGSATEISVSGTALFDLKTGIVTRGEFTLSQQRDIGLMAPGLDAVFKLVTKMEPVPSSPHLTDQGLAELRKNAGGITDKLVLHPTGSTTSLIHPRQWRVISNLGTRTVMRYIRRGRMLGQCDIIPLPNRITSQPQTLEQFRQVVKNKLANNSAEITAADESTTGSGLEWLRVQASGTSNGVRLNWIYYTVTHPDGRRIQLVFTTEPANASQFAGSENHLIDSLRFDKLPKTNSRNASYSKSDKTAAGQKPR